MNAERIIQQIHRMIEGDYRCNDVTILSHLVGQLMVEARAEDMDAISTEMGRLAPLIRNNGLDPARCAALQTIQCMIAGYLNAKLFDQWNHKPTYLEN